MIKDRLDILIDKLLKSKYKNIERAKKDPKVSILFKNKKDLSFFSKKEKLLLIETLGS
jgi:hypothetical protein